MTFRFLAVILMPFVLLVCSGCCEPDCKNKCCGDDGCGGKCPDRCEAPRYICEPSVCKCALEEYPNCTGKCCGGDGIGGTCPDNCLEGTHCNTEICVCEMDPVPCTTDADCNGIGCCVDQVCIWMDCAGFMCGPDRACGLECGPCDEGKECDEFNMCISSCVLGLLGDPCYYSPSVNRDACHCALGFNCIGEYELGDCVDPGECQSPPSYNPDCYMNKCGYSFCSVSCEVEQCPAEFVEDRSLGECYCFPE